MKDVKVPVDTMITTTIWKFRRKLGAFRQRARFEPVEITRHRRRAERFDWMEAASRRTCRTSDTAAVVIDAVKRATMPPEHEPLDELLK
jgi:hypothetical protein